MFVEGIQGIAQSCRSFILLAISLLAVCVKMAIFIYPFFS